MSNSANNLATPVPSVVETTVEGSTTTVRGRASNALAAPSASGGAAHHGAPGPFHDSSKAWRVGAIYIDKETHGIYVCIDNKPGTAVWIELEQRRAVGLMNQLPKGELMDLTGL
jgi:hypothetical protein